MIYDFKKTLQNYKKNRIYASAGEKIPKNRDLAVKACVCQKKAVILQREKNGKHILRFDDTGSVIGSTAGFVAFG